MSVDAHVPSCAAQTLSFTIRDVLLSLGIPVLLGHTKIDHMNYWDIVSTKGTWRTPVHSPLAPLVPGRPIKKLSGLMSRYIRFFSCIVCTRDSCKLGEPRTIRLSLITKRKGTRPHHLSCSHADGLYRELPPAHIEKIFETGSKEVDDQDVVQTFLAKVVDLRDSS
jgi:hypothetical protein